MNAAGMPRQAWRWVLAFGLVALAHGGLIALLGRQVAPAEQMGEPVLLIDMEPVPTPQAAHEPEPPQPDPVPVQNPLPPDLAPPPSPATDFVPTTQAAPTEPPSPEPLPADPSLPAPPRLPESVRPPVVMPQRVRAAVRPKPAPPMQMSRPDETRASAPPVAAPPSPAAATAPASVPISWQVRLLAHLNRFKHYPADAQMRRRQGTATVHLRLMANGSAEAVRLQSSSGTEALDQEAIALIGRAAPLPVPEGNIGSIDLAVPIQFTLR